VPQVYLDSCIVIYLIQAADSIRDTLQKVLRGDNPKMVPRIYISALTRLECRVWPLRQKELELLAEFDRFFASRDLRRIRLTTAIFDLATELRADHGVKTPDALHLAAAIQGGCNEFWANDHRIPRAIEGEIMIRTLP